MARAVRMRLGRLDEGVADVVDLATQRPTPR